jgi:hypothetical protein
VTASTASEIAFLARALKAPRIAPAAKTFAKKAVDEGWDHTSPGLYSLRRAGHRPQTRCASSLITRPLSPSVGSTVLRETPALAYGLVTGAESHPRASYGPASSS